MGPMVAAQGTGEQWLDQDTGNRLDRSLASESDQTTTSFPR